VRNFKGKKKVVFRLSYPYNKLALYQTQLANYKCGRPLYLYPVNQPRNHSCSSQIGGTGKNGELKVDAAACNS